MQPILEADNMTSPAPLWDDARIWEYLERDAFWMSVDDGDNRGLLIYIGDAYVHVQVICNDYEVERAAAAQREQALEQELARLNLTMETMAQTFQGMVDDRQKQVEYWMERSHRHEQQVADRTNKLDNAINSYRSLRTEANTLLQERNEAEADNERLRAQVADLTASLAKLQAAIVAAGVRDEVNNELDRISESEGNDE